MMISYECCNDCEDRKSAVCYRCNSKPHIAEFYNSDIGTRILNFGGEKFRVINVENYNGGKKVYCEDTLDHPTLFTWKYGIVSLQYIELKIERDNIDDKV